METTKPQKLSAYMHASGQDTKGQLFEVAATIPRDRSQSCASSFTLVVCVLVKRLPASQHSSLQGLYHGVAHPDCHT